MSKLSQPGRALPLARVAVIVRLSPASTSAKVPAGTTKPKAVSSDACCAVSATATVGASFTAATVSKNVSKADSVPSLAFTFNCSTPLKLAGGVPEKVRVAVSKLSQPGRALPLARVAEIVRLSPVSTSAKVPTGTTKLHAVSSKLLWGAMGKTTTGASLRFVTTRVTALVLENSPSEAVRLMW